MKHLIVTLLCAAAALAAPAQTAEFGCLTITPYVDPATGFDDATSRLLQQKLAYAVSLANASGGFDKRFVITPKADVVQQTTTATIPQKVVLRVQLTVYVGDGIDGTLFASCQKELTGIGGSRQQALQAAVRKLNARDEELQQTIVEGRERIEDYYEKMAPKLLAEARSLLREHKYDEAVATLAVVPRSCDRYEEARELAATCTRAAIDNANSELLIKARAAWSASPDEKGAAEAAAWLGAIENPSAPTSAAADKLTGEMESRLTAAARERLAVERQRIRSEENVRKKRIDASARVAGKLLDAMKPSYKVVRWF